MSHKEVGDLLKSDTPVTERGQDGQWKVMYKLFAELGGSGFKRKNRNTELHGTGIWTKP